MDVVYRQGKVTAGDIHRALPDPPTYTSVRGLLRVLVDKRHLIQEQEGKRYVYRPSTSRAVAGATTIAHVVRTFFAGSAADAMAALIGSDPDQISDADLARLSALVREARAQKRNRS
jgi:predicted transcriptional regulator